MEEKSIENYWYKECTSGSGNPLTSNCRKLGNSCSSNFFSFLWLTTVEDGIRVRMTVDLTIIVMFLYFIPMFPWKSDSLLLGIANYCSTPWRSVPRRGFHHGKFVAASYDCPFSHCQEQGTGMRCSLVGLNQVQNTDGPQDGTSICWGGGVVEKWKRREFSSWPSPLNNSSKSFHEEYLQRKHQAFRLTYNMSQKCLFPRKNLEVYLFFKRLKLQTQRSFQLEVESK